MQRLSAQGSVFSRKIHAAKLFALLRSAVLLESHLGIFAARQDDVEEEEEEESEEEGEEEVGEEDQFW